MKHHFTPKLAIIFTTAALFAACNQTKEKEQEVKPVSAPAINFEDPNIKASYAIGVASGKSMIQNIKSLEGTGIELDLAVITEAFADGMQGNTKLDEETLAAAMNEFRTKVNAAMQEKRALEQAEQAKAAEQNTALGTAFLTENKTKEGVVTLESGLQYKVLTKGTGKSPSATDKVKVHYKGTLIDGSQFDSSYDRGQPATFGVNQVIKGWTEALQLMKEGAKWQLAIPADIAYGPTSRPKIPGNSVLLFDVELLEVVSAPAAE